MNQPRVMKTTMARPIRCCWDTARSGFKLLLGRLTDAVRAFRLLSGGVGADGRAGDDRLGVNHDHATLDRRGEAVETARGRAALLLADPVVLRPVARALEPLRRLAPRHPAAQVHALLVQVDDAL